MKAYPTDVNTIIVGGGHAGVNLACMLELQRKGSEYLILEKSDSLLSKWRYKRWDHFQLNTPVIFSRLHGQKIDVDDPWLLDRPLKKDLEGWDNHIEELKILEHTKLNANVVSVKPQPDGTFQTVVDEGGETTTVYQSKNVVACNGVYDHNIIPSELSDALPPSIQQHTSGGFRLDDLAPGNILVVGSSQSGIQLSNILVNKLDPKSQKIYLSCSSAGGCPRRFRGHDLFYWLDRMKFLYIPKEALAGMPPEKAEALRYGGSGSPVTGPNQAISPFSLERKGVILTGRLADVEKREDGASTLVFNDDRCNSLQAAKEGHSKLVGMLRDFASKLEAETGESFLPETPEAEWEITNENLLTDPGILSLDVEEAGITNVLWACGWASNLGWLKVDQDPKTNDDFNERTNLPNQVASKKYPGLFYAGYPWVGTIQSMNILNMDKDAEVILKNMID